jgi:hypothetical protein
MRLKCISCETLARIAYLCAARSPHIVDVELVQRGLHNRPGHLRSNLQARIDAVRPEVYDAVVLVYGLCGQSTLGLKAGHVPLVIPRAHDCITLFLGSRERYKEEFESHPGTYWYAQDYMERNADMEGVPATAISMGSAADADLQAQYDGYVEKYGKENADYLMEVMGAWHSHYSRAVFIDTGVVDGSAVEARARAEAGRRGWAFERTRGDLVLVRRLLAADWGDGSGDDFLILQPGQHSLATYDDTIVAAGDDHD